MNYQAFEKATENIRSAKREIQVLEKDKERLSETITKKLKLGIREYKQNGSLYHSWDIQFGSPHTKEVISLKIKKVIEEEIKSLEYKIQEKQNFIYNTKLQFG